MEKQSEYMTTGAIAKEFGYSRARVWQWTCEGKVPYIQAGKGAKRLIKRADLLNFLTAKAGKEEYSG